MCAVFEGNFFGARLEMKRSCIIQAVASTLRSRRSLIELKHSGHFVIFGSKIPGMRLGAVVE